MRYVLLFALVSTVLAACATDDVGTARAALRGDPGVNLFDDLPGPIASATVYIDIGSTSCTGTLIAPRLVLTAAHCLLTGNRMSIRYDGGSGSVSVTSCWVHPESVGGRVDVATCEELAGLTEDDIRIHHDVAILEVAQAMDAPVRTIGPPRWCLDTNTGSARSQSRGARFRSGMLLRTRREAIPSSYRTLGTHGTQHALCFLEDVLHRGDSGGTIDADDDPAGPVVALNSQFGLGDGSCNQQPLLWQHHPGAGPLGDLGLRNIDWIWSVLDPGRSCTFGSPGPCLPARIGSILSDGDGDGLPDVRDLCPRHPLRPESAAACANQHCDADFDWVGDDCDAYDGLDSVPGVPNDEVVACNHDDPDGDGLPSAADPCPNIHASVTHPERDRDGDGAPDACDVCPGIDDSTVDFSQDGDGDGVPDECDSCRSDPNPLQADCNLDAVEELWRVACPVDPGTGAPACTLPEFLGFEGGDVCDDTPCGETRVATETLGARTSREIVQNVVRVDARADTLREARTGFRFCRCSLATRDSFDRRVACRDAETLPGGSTIGNCLPLDTLAYDALAEPSNWRWTTMAFPGPDGSRASPELRTERDLSYEPVPREGVFHTDLWADWRLRDRDVPRWREGFGEPIPDGIIASVPGVLWTHTPGPIGGGDATEWERPRASHFWSGRGQMRSAPPVPLLPPFPCIQAITPWIARGVFGPAPVPWIGFSTTVCGIVLPDLNVVLRVGPDVFAGQPGFDPAWLREFEVPDVRWVAAAESDDWLPEEDLRYVGLSAGDLALRAMLVEQEGELIDVIKQQPCAPNQCEPVLVARTAGALAAAATPSPLLVLSARRRTLWSLDEVPASDARVRALDLGARTWRELVPQGEPLGRILAATYAPRDDVLWLLDEVGRGPRRTEARLVRVEVGLRNARARVVARWPRVTTNDRFALAVDPAGALYLAGTQARGALSVVVRIERSSRGHEPTGFVVREGGFVHEGLRANEHGVTLVLDDPDEGAFPILLDEMQPGRGGIAQCL